MPINSILRSCLTAIVFMGAPGALLAEPGSAWADFDNHQWGWHDWEFHQRVERMTRSELDNLMTQADEGDVEAQALVGVAFREGIERHTIGAVTARTGTDNQMAHFWLERAAAAGYPIAQLELARMYYQAHGVPRDIERAIALARDAAKHPFPRARMTLRQIEFAAAPSAETLQALATTAFGSAYGMYQLDVTKPNFGKPQ